MAVPADVTADRSRPWGRDLLLLLLAFGALYFFRLGSYPLSNPDEGRNAEVPREMIASGDWVTPRLNGVNYFEKPPLVYWVTAAFEKAFGLNEWSVRAVPALFAIAGLLLTYAAARGLYGRTTGILAATVLGTSVLWFIVGHIPLLDTAVSVFMAATLFCFLLAIREPAGRRRRWLFMGLYVSAALATLTKGLMGFLVTGAVMFIWLIFCGQWKRLRPLYLPTGALVFLAIALPWHILAAQRNETWFDRYIVFEHFQRFLTPAASRPGPWHYFIWVVIAGLIPWTGFLWRAARESLAGGVARRSEHADRWFFIIWIAFIVCFFSISKSKLATYILPVFPALAVLIAVELQRALVENTWRRIRGAVYAFAGLFGLLAAAVVVVLIRPALAKLDAEQVAALRVPGSILVVVLLAAAVVVPWLGRTRGVRAAIVGCVAAMAMFYMNLEFAAPAINKPGTKDLALYVKAHAKVGDRVFHCYDFYQDFTFYAEREVGVVGDNVAELELKEDAAARASGRFISEAELREQWNLPGRIFLVVQIRKIQQVTDGYAAAVAAWEKKRAISGAGGAQSNEQPPERPVFADPSFHYHLIAQTPEYYLVSNQP